MKLHQIVDNVFTDKEAVRLGEILMLHPSHRCPAFLGNFGYEMYRAPRMVPIYLRDACKKLAALVPEQRFNTIFIQSYAPGTSVNRHRDPRSNIGYTIIAPFGLYEGAESTVELPGEVVKYTARPGQAVIQACTINGVQGPYHSVAEIKSSYRFAIILNTLV